MTKCTNGPMTSKFLNVETELSEAALRRFDDCAVRELGMEPGEFELQTLKRVSLFRRRHMNIASSHHMRAEKVNEDNSWIAVGEDAFGKVVDILWLHQRRVAVIDMRLFRKKRLFESNGEERLYPVNSFPVEVTNEWKTFVVTDELQIRKVLYATMKYDGERLDEHVIFGIRPNEWFRF